MKLKVLSALILAATFLAAQPELDIKPNRIEFEDLFSRFDYTCLINKGNQILTIDSLKYENSMYIIDFENNLQLPFTILPDDTVRMNVTLSAFYNITISDTSDTILIYNNGLVNPDSLRVKIDFFEDEFGEFNGTVNDSLSTVDSAIVHFFYNGIYLIDTARTNSSGFYRKSLPEGEYTIGVEKEGYYVVFHDSTYDPFFAEFVELDSGDVKTINFNLKRIDDPNLSVSGTIIDSINGINVNKGIIIVRTGTHVPTPLNKENSLQLDALNTFAGFIRADGSYSVNIQSPDYYYLQAYTNNFLPGYYNDEGIASVYWQNADSIMIDTNITGKDISLLRDSSYGNGSIGGTISFATFTDEINFEGISLFARNINTNALYSYNFGKKEAVYNIFNIPYGTYEIVAQKIGYSNAVSQIVTIDTLNFQITGINITFSPTSVDEQVELPTDFILYQNYPNPFNPSTSLQYAIGSRQFVTLKVYDLLGREVATLVNEEKPSGNYEVSFDASSLASGMYLYRLQTSSFIETKKMILLR